MDTPDLGYDPSWRGQPGFSVLSEDLVAKWLTRLRQPQHRLPVPQSCPDEELRVQHGTE